MGINQELPTVIVIIHYRADSDFLQNYSPSGSYVIYTVDLVFKARKYHSSTLTPGNLLLYSHVSTLQVCLNTVFSLTDNTVI